MYVCNFRYQTTYAAESHLIFSVTLSLLQAVLHTREQSFLITSTRFILYFIILKSLYIYIFSFVFVTYIYEYDATGGNVWSDNTSTSSAISIGSELSSKRSCSSFFGNTWLGLQNGLKKNTFFFFFFWWRCSSAPYVQSIVKDVFFCYAKFGWLSWLILLNIGRNIKYGI